MYVTQIYKYIFITNTSSLFVESTSYQVKVVIINEMRVSVVVIFIKNSEKIKQKNENS